MDYTKLVEPATYADEKEFHGLLGHMRLHDPVAHIETSAFRPFYAITRHADILEISRNNDIFINGPRAILTPREIEESRAQNTQFQSRVLIAVDGEEHTRLRGLTRDWFLPQNLAKMEEEIRKIAREHVAHMLSLGEEFDFVKDVAVWYPLRIIMKILGVPGDMDQLMLTMTQQMFGSNDPDVTEELTPEARLQVFMDFYQYCLRITEDRRAHPTDDLASAISNALIDGEPMTDMDTMGYYLIVASAGHDTTSSSTAGAMHAMIENPRELEKVKDDPALIPGMVDEAIRWVTPVKHFMRTATEDYRLRNNTIRAGESVMLLYPSANRDEDVFDAPFEFRVERRPNRHLAFGHGAHHCLGNLLARMEMRILFEELLPKVESVELNGEPKLIRSSFVSGLKTLPIRLKPS